MNTGVINGLGRQPQNLVDEAGNVLAGEFASATGLSTIALGNFASASGAYGTAIGHRASATGLGSIALGGYLKIGTIVTSPIAAGVAAIAIGVGVTPNTGARASGDGSIAIGGSNASTAASASSTGGIAVGTTATSSGSGAIALGQSATGTANRAVAIGYFSSVTVAESIAVGAFATSGSAQCTISIGAATTAAKSASATAAGAIAMGGTITGTNGARATAAGAIAIGGADSTDCASATAADAMSLGRGTVATHARAIAFGQGVATTAVDQVNLGIKRAFIGVPTTVAADADLIASQITEWLDEARDFAPAWKAKNSGATVKTGSIDLGAWTAWTPTVTQSAAATFTTTYARYCKTGRMVTLQCLLAITGGSTVAANAVVIGGLPVAAAVASNVIVGQGAIQDASAADTIMGFAYLPSTTTVSFVSTRATGNVLGTGGGFAAALANTDLVWVNVTYEAAS